MEKVIRPCFSLALSLFTSHVLHSACLPPCHKSSINNASAGHISTLYFSVLPSSRASFMMDAPLGGSRLQVDLKNGSACWQASSPGFKPSHIPLKSRTFSSSRDMISVSFCLNKSDQQRQKDRWREETVL